MALRRLLVLVVCAGAAASMGASYRTTNFIAEGPTPQIAKQLGDLAEYYRREKAMLWLGRELPNWPEPCPLHAKVTMSGAGGATSFGFDGRGHVTSRDMHIDGSLDRLLSSVLPHKVTHTVFADHFRQPVPRWADEGGAVLSEDDTERNRHDMLCRQILNTPGRAIPLRRLFALTQYPPDVMALYAQGFSVANFLVASSNRQVFLNFVGQGMTQGWDVACQTHYHYRSVEELEQAWLTHLRNTKRQPAELASRTTPDPRYSQEGNGAGAVVVRQTVPPAQPVLTAAPASAVYRGAAPTTDQGERFGDRSGAIPVARAVPQPPPDYYPAAAAPPPTYYPGPLPAAAPQPGWQPASPETPPTVMLGQPQPCSSPPPAAPPPGYPYPR